MAKIRYGMLAGSISGSQGNTTFSHNRYGAYLRTRTIPTKTTTPYAQAAKANLALASKLWGTLTDQQRHAWNTWARTNPITDRLGDKRILDGHAASTRLAANLLTAGNTPISIPPAVGAPLGLLTAAAVYDIGAGNFQITYTTTPLSAGIKLMVWAAVTNSPGRSYVANLYKLCLITAAAAASPASTEAALTARFGNLAVGQHVYYNLQTIDTATGLLSGLFPLNGTIIST